MKPTPIQICELLIQELAKLKLADKNLEPVLVVSQFIYDGIQEKIQDETFHSVPVEVCPEAFGTQARITSRYKQTS